MINVLEERFNENGICFEPGYEGDRDDVKVSFNKAVEYAKYKTCILEAFNSSSFEVFKDIMQSELRENFDYLLDRLHKMKALNCGKPLVTIPCFNNVIICEYDSMIEKMTILKKGL